jgi:hypothetical protein
MAKTHAHADADASTAPLTPVTSNKSTKTTSSRRSSLSEHVAHWVHKVDDKLARARPYVERLSGTYEPVRRDPSPEVEKAGRKVK